MAAQMAGIGDPRVRERFLMERALEPRPVRKALPGVLKDSVVNNTGYLNGSIPLPVTPAKEVRHLEFGKERYTVRLVLENAEKSDIDGISIVQRSGGPTRLAAGSHGLGRLSAGGTDSIELVLESPKTVPVGVPTRLSLAVVSGGREIASEELSIVFDAPREYGLYRNFPNPFNPRTIIAFQLPAEADVKIVLYDMLGREAAVLLHEQRLAGYYELPWEADAFPSGVYFYRLFAVEPNGSRYTASGKMMLIK